MMRSVLLSILTLWRSATTMEVQEALSAVDIPTAAMTLPPEVRALLAHEPLLSLE